MDFVQGISLQELLFKSTFQRDFADNQIMNTFYPILECAAYMASQGIMHRDLKPSNIIIEKDGKVNPFPEQQDLEFKNSRPFSDFS